MTRRRHGLVVAVTGMWLAAALAGCGSGSAESPGTATSPSTQAPATTLTAFAAASLKKTFTEIGASFERQNPGVTVTFSFAGSSDLIAQIIAGAPAAVFASADTATMTKATEAGLVAGSPVDFATNTLTIVTPRGNPAAIRGFSDLAQPDLAVVVCAPQVPCGAATQKLEAATGVTLTPVSEESSVTDVLNKVTTGEADAGLVYVTDASAAGERVSVVGFPESTRVVNTYPIAALTGAENPALATKYVEFVTGPDGQRVLADAGFEPAP